MKSSRFRPPIEWKPTYLFNKFDNTGLKTRLNKYFFGLVQLISKVGEEITIDKIENPKMIEIVSFNGESTLIFGASMVFDKIYCIDPLDTKSLDFALDYQTCDEIEKQFNQNVSWFNGNGKELGQTKVELIKDYSYNVVDQFEDNSFDFIYIDGAHDYESVKKDIELYAPKLKTFGILAGHDYEHTWPGVIKAVDEIVISPQQLIIMDDSSWMIKKINTSFQ